MESARPARQRRNRQLSAVFRDRAANVARQWWCERAVQRGADGRRQAEPDSRGVEQCSGGDHRFRRHESTVRLGPPLLATSQQPRPVES